MEPVSIGPLRVRAFGGEDRQGGGDGPAVLLCHGFGAPGDDLVALARAVDAGREVRWFFPEAPNAIDLGYGMTGRAWWKIDMARLESMIARRDRATLKAETPDGLSEARAALEACVEALERIHGVRRERLVLGGFSQGAMLTTELALHADRPFAGLAILSGALISAERWQAAAALTGRTLHALQSHGRADPILPFDGAEELRALLVESGAAVEFVPHGGQHEIPAVVLQRLGAFLRARLG